MIELAAAVLLIAGGIVLYRGRGRDDPHHGSQTAVLLLVVGIILAIHGTWQLEYHPSAAEIEAAQ